MSENELFLHDVRLQERFLSDGTLDPAVHKKHLEALPDLADQCEEFDLEQPALAKEQAEPTPAPALAEAVSSVGVPAVAPVSPFATPAEAGPPAQPVAPAPVPAASPFGAPAASAPEAAPPAPEARPEPAAAPDPHGPASIPPPTASVDADWGDS